MPNKKTCIILSTLNAGGIENRILRYLKFLPDTNGITIMVKSGKKGDLYQEMLSTGVAIHFQSIGYFNVFKIGKLYRFFKREQFETVCDCCGNFSGISLTTARFSGVKNRVAFFVRSTHAFKMTRFNLTYARLSNKLIFQNATKILSNSKAALDFFFPYRKVGDLRFKVLPNAVDAATFDSQFSKQQAQQAIGLPEGCFVVGHVGRLDAAKNHQTILKVAQELTQKHSDIRFVFCGKDTDSEKFTDMISQAGLNDKALVLGMRNDVDTVLRAMDVFYFPSVTEGQPNALIEAVLSGLPVISSNIASIKEIIPPQSHKFLVAPHDVKSAVSLIEKVKSGELDQNQIIFKDQMISLFDPLKNFKLLHDEL